MTLQRRGQSPTENANGRTGILSWTWTPIESDDQLAGERAPAPDELRLDERWLALVLLATQTNPGTRAGYRGDINAFMRWWHALTTARPLEASRSDVAQYDAWLASSEPPVASVLHRSPPVSCRSGYPGELANDETTAI